MSLDRQSWQIPFEGAATIPGIPVMLLYNNVADLRLFNDYNGFFGAGSPSDQRVFQFGELFARFAKNPHEMGTSVSPRMSRIRPVQSPALVLWDHLEPGGLGLDALRSASGIVGS
jgi:hypothetical protein